MLAICRYVVMPSAFSFSSMNGPIPLMTWRSSFTITTDALPKTRVTPETPVRVFPSLPVQLITVEPLSSVIAALPLSANSFASATSSVLAPFLTSLFNLVDEATPMTLKLMVFARDLTR